MTKLVMRLFGGFHVELHGETVHGFESDKGRALLAYLVVGSDRPHRRESVASLLWPDRPDVVARKNLRQAVHPFFKLFFLFGGRFGVFALLV